MKKINIAIIGAGIVGCNISYFLNKNNIENILLEKSSSLFDNASGCAGAFITPTIGKNSEIKTMLDNAFAFSTSFYDSLDDVILSKGTISLVDEYKEEYEQNIPHRYEKISKYNQKGYLFLDAMTINPISLAKKLTFNSQILHNYEAKNLEYKNQKWIINNEIQANKIILSLGSSTSLIDEPYINIRGVLGTKIDITSSTNVQTAINRGIYFSKSTNDKISLGATHHRHTTNISKEQDAQYLLNKLQNVTSFNDIKIQNTKQGIRACSNDYFPLVGEIIDSKKTLDRFPYIKHGTNIRAQDAIMKENIFICNGVGGRGFSLAPYIVNILINHILDKSPIPKNLGLHKRFIKFHRRANKNLSVL